MAAGTPDLAARRDMRKKICQTPGGPGGFPGRREDGSGRTRWRGLPTHGRHGNIRRTPTESPIVHPRPALVLVDVQQGLAAHHGDRNHPEAERHAGALLAAWRRIGAPIVHVQHHSVHPHSPLRPGQPGVEPHEAVRPLPGEAVFRKSVANPFLGTPLEGHLRRHGIGQVVVAGLTTEHCVSSTARAAADLGFEVTVVADASACFGRTSFDGQYHAPDTIHRLALVALHEEFAAIRTTAEVLASLAADVIHYPAGAR